MCSSDLNELAAARQDAERLAQFRQPAHRLLAQLWLALGDTEQAKHHALAAYRWAWADGEPYVHRYELTKATELLQRLNVPLPNLPPYDPANEEPLAWEADVVALVERVRAEQEKEAKASAEARESLIARLRQVLAEQEQDPPASDDPPPADL